MMDLPKPTPGDGEVLVHLSAAGVNPYDWKLIDGALEGRWPHVFPMIVGADGAGVVEELGPNVHRFGVGDGIFGQFVHPPVGIGTYAEYATVPENIGVAKMPRGMYSAQAAAVPTAGMTALQSLDEMSLARGQILLVLGASGGVGSFATQIAANRGVHVLAASRGSNWEYLRKFGAREFVNLANVGYLDELKLSHPSGVDGILDLTNRGPAFDRHLPLVKPGGVVASTIGAADVPALQAKGLKGLNIDMHPTSELLDRLSADFATGMIRIPLERQAPLAEAPEILRQSREGTLRGKVVLTI